jgi:glutathione peroxidase
LYHALAAPGRLTAQRAGRRTPRTMNVHSFSAKTIQGQERELSAYAGKVLLVVNVASKCGLTPQYTALEKLYRENQGAGLMVLGFPCNQFAGQEPGTEAEIERFCTIHYDVTFPLFAKLDVNGSATHPLYAYMKNLDTRPDGPRDVSWNFAKFLVGRDGSVLARFAPREDPAGPVITGAIAQALAA